MASMRLCARADRLGDRRPPACHCEERGCEWDGRSDEALRQAQGFVLSHSTSLMMLRMMLSNVEAFIEGRIITLEKMLRNAKIINDEEVVTDVVSIGSTVKLKDIEFDEEVEYTIVGSAESDPTVNMISNESPVGKALLGKQIGATVEVSVPAGVIKYEILDIKK